MHEQLLIERRRSRFGAERIPVGLQLSRLLEQANRGRRRLDPLKRATRAEHAFERRGRAGRTQRSRDDGWQG